MKRIIALISFFFFYVFDVIKSNVRVAIDVLTPNYGMTPGIISLDVDGMNDAQILVMANLITMTPGTLGLVVSEDKKRLYLHIMYLEDSPEATARDLEANYGRRVRDVI